MDRVHPALEVSEDAEEIGALLRRLDERGTGAARQRALWIQARSAGEFTDALASVTRNEPVPSWTDARASPAAASLTG